MSLVIFAQKGPNGHSTVRTKRLPHGPSLLGVRKTALTKSNASRHLPVVAKRAAASDYSPRATSSSIRGQASVGNSPVSRRARLGGTYAGANCARFSVQPAMPPMPSYGSAHERVLQLPLWSPDP
jgi:hypothetical protein